MADGDISTDLTLRSLEPASAVPAAGERRSNPESKGKNRRRPPDEENGDFIESEIESEEDSSQEQLAHQIDRMA